MKRTWKYNLNHNGAKIFMNYPLVLKTTAVILHYFRIRLVTFGLIALIGKLGFGLKQTPQIQGTLYHPADGVTSHGILYSLCHLLNTVVVTDTSKSGVPRNLNP